MHSSLCVSSDLPNKPGLLNESPSQSVLLNESPSQMLNEPMNLLQADVNFETGNLFALQIL